MVQSWIDSPFAEKAVRISYSRGTIIHAEDEIPRHAMVLLTGKVKITKQGNSQRDHIFRFLSPGDIFAYRAIIAGDLYNAQAVALTDCECLCLSVEDFLSLLQSDKDFCFRLLRKMSYDLAQAERQTLALTQKHVRGRLADALLYLVSRYGFEEDGCTLAVNLSREEIANLSNMITANAIRTLSDFAHEEIIAINGRAISITNIKALQHISQLG